MAIKITKPGQKEFHGFCKWCGCEFTYEISDLKLSATSDKLSCPTCGKDYHHPSMVQDPTLPSGIGYQWPSDSTDPCAGCTWRDNLLRDGIYVGDTPCTWCNKNKFNSITCSQPSIKDYTTPCVNELDSYLTTTSSEFSSTGYTTAHNSISRGESDSQTSAGVSDGSVMTSILKCCNDCVSNINKCDDMESNSSNTGSKCAGKQNCKGRC